MLRSPQLLSFAFVSVIILSMLVVVLPSGYPVDTQLFKSLLLIPLIVAFVLVVPWSKRASLPASGYIGLLVFSALSAFFIGVLHSSSLQSFVYGGLLLGAGLSVWVLGARLESSVHGVKSYEKSFEYGLACTGLVLAALSLPASEYFNLRELQIFGPIALPLTHGGFAQPNNFGSFLGSVLAVSMWFRYRDADGLSSGLKFGPLVNFLGIVFLVVFMVNLTGSRVGALGVLLTAGVWFLNGVYRRQLRQIIESLLVVLAMLVVGWSDAHDLVLAYSHGASEPLIAAARSSLDIRFSFWLAALVSQFDSVWLGSGFGSFHLEYPMAYQNHEALLAEYPYLSSSVTYHPHNEILNLWVSGGVFGLLFVGLPLLLGVFGLVGIFVTWKNAVNLVPLLPIGLHLNTELPFAQSGLHWIFIVTFLALVGTRTGAFTAENRSLGFPLAVRVPIAAICLLCVSVAWDVVRVGHQARLNTEFAKGFETVSDYIRERADDRELSHWAYKESAGHRWILELYLRALKEGNLDVVKRALPQVKSAVQFYNSKNSWNLLAAGYATLGMRAELTGFLEYIAKLDPRHAEVLRREMGL